MIIAELGRLEGERVADRVGDPVPGHGVLPGLGGLHLRRPPRRRVRRHVAPQLPGKNVNPGYSCKHEFFLMKVLYQTC